VNIMCEKRCSLIRMFANLRCSDCFDIKASVDEKNQCDCRVTVNPDRIWGWD
jgi:hypothetical protein